MMMMMLQTQKGFAVILTGALLGQLQSCHI